MLKPGQLFALDEWCMTDKYDPGNSRHRSIKAEIELGNGLPDIRTTKQCIQALKDAGFEVSSTPNTTHHSIKNRRNSFNFLREEISPCLFEQHSNNHKKNLKKWTNICTTCNCDRLGLDLK